MARLHLVYDPDGRLTMPPTDMIKQLKLQIAIMDIPDDLTDEKIAEIAEQLSKLFLGNML